MVQISDAKQQRSATIQLVNHCRSERAHRANDLTRACRAITANSTMATRVTPLYCAHSKTGKPMAMAPILLSAFPQLESGTYGFSVRVLPTHPCLMQGHELRLITWS